jgi:hypothetical protein
MTSGSRHEIVDSLRLVGGYHGVWAYSIVFWVPSLLPGPPSSEVNEARVGSWRDCFVMPLLGGDAFSRGVMRWMIYRTPCTGLWFTATYRGDMAYLQDVIRCCRGDGRWCLLGEGKLLGASLPDEGFVLFSTYL